MAKKPIKTKSKQTKPEQTKPKPEGYVFGRPHAYHDSYCQLILDLAREGKGVAHWASAIGVCRDSLYEWAEKHKDFSDALKIAAEIRETWWVDQAARQANGGMGNAGITKFILASNFGMKERADNSVTIAHATDGKIELKFGEVKPE